MRSLHAIAQYGYPGYVPYLWTVASLHNGKINTPFKPHPDSKLEFCIRPHLTACGTSPAQGEVYPQSGQKLVPNGAGAPVPLLEKERLGEVLAMLKTKVFNLDVVYPSVSASA
jgi:hypothetical protein